MIAALLSTFYDDLTHSRLAAGVCIHVLFAN